MKSRVQLLLTMAFLWSGSTMPSGMSAGSLDELKALSGLDKQVADIQASTVAGMQEESRQAPAAGGELLAELEGSLAAAFSPDDINSLDIDN